MTEPWPRLPREAVESPSLEIFQPRLATVLCSLLWVTLLGQGVGLGDPQRSLPTPAMLGFCETSTWLVLGRQKYLWIYLDLWTIHGAQISSSRSLGSEIGAKQPRGRGGSLRGSLTSCAVHEAAAGANQRL